MSNFNFITVDSNPKTCQQWIETIGSVNDYSKAYLSSLNQTQLYPKDTSEAMMSFVSYLQNAKTNHKKIFIYGDYDSDGVCATAIAHHLLSQLDIPHGYYIPNRFSEGYGLNTNRIQQAYDKGYTTLLTVDTGIVAFDHIAFAQQLGMDVLISDHHTITQLPNCWVLHPDLMDAPFKGLCGAGVIYELSRHFIQDPLLDCLAMVATIGDMMQLENENRRIVLHGLAQLKHYRIASIAALLTKVDDVDETAIAFQVVPKLNAIGRLDDSNPNQLVPYLLNSNDYYCQQGAVQINAVNQKRKELVASTSEHVEVVLNDSIVIAKSDCISSGIVGLVAAQLVGKYKKPSLVFTLENGSYKASGRSVEGFDLYHALSSLNYEHFDSFGGHAGALGCSVAADYFDDFIQCVKVHCSNWEVVPVSKNVLVIDQHQIDDQLMMALQLLKPNDKTHPQPLFMIKDPHIEKTMVLKGLYPKLVLDNGVEVLSFKVSELNQLCHSQWIVTLKPNVFRNKVTIQAMVEEIVRF